jgi:hypothetical protein
VLTVTEQTDELPEVGDPIRTAVYPLIELVMDLTPSGSLERAAAMNEVLAAAERVRLSGHALDAAPEPPSIQQSSVCR